MKKEYWKGILCGAMMCVPIAILLTSMHLKQRKLATENIQLLREYIQLQAFSNELGMALLDKQPPVKLLNSLPYPDNAGETETYFIHSVLRDRADTPVPVNLLFIENIKTGKLLRVFSNDITLSQRALELSRFEEDGVPGTSYKILDEVETRVLLKKLGKRYIP